MTNKKDKQDWEDKKCLVEQSFQKCQAIDMVVQEAYTTETH